MRLALVLPVLLLLVPGAVGAAKRNEAEEAYQGARRSYYALKDDAARRKLRHHWLNVVRKFEAVASRHPKSDRAPDALFTAAELLSYKEAHPGIEIIGHPECHPDVIAVCDFAGSTSGMINYVKDNRPSRVLLVTECSMASNIQAELPGVDFVKPCNLCPHMKRITLPKILDSLVSMTEEVLVDPAIADRARLAVERMVNLKQ